MRLMRGDRSCSHEPDWHEPAYAVWVAANTPVPCAWGNCVNYACGTCGRLTGSGFGSLTCPCDQLPGWKSSHAEGMAKPHPRVKVAGRHHDRIRNAQRRHAVVEARSNRILVVFG